MMWENIKKILITGGAGFIGYFISKILAEDMENEIHILDKIPEVKMMNSFWNW